MNSKQQALDRIVDIVVSCCNTDVNGKPSVTREGVLGRSRAENLVMTRCILVAMIHTAGYSITTAALLLGRTEAAIRHMMTLYYDFLSSSRAFAIANAEATLLCKDIE